VNLRARRAEPRRRRLYLCDPVAALHMELPAQGSSLDWELLAGEARRWALGQGIPISGPVVADDSSPSDSSTSDSSSR
jgi:hypothetical protein